MSRRHPIIAVTGSSGAGTTTTGNSFSSIFTGEGIDAAMVAGDSFHRYTRDQMTRLAAKGQFGERNHFALVPTILIDSKRCFMTTATQAAASSADTFTMKIAN